MLWAGRKLVALDPLEGSLSYSFIHMVKVTGYPRDWPLNARA